ncbi:MAG: 3-isopropylmalate dehydratase small subunit [Acetobacteraceae bacterium]
MEPFTRLDAVAVPMPTPNIDTDQVIPARFLSRPRSEGLAECLFHDLRRRPDGSENADYVMNQPAFRAARILVAERNFGCGSSRENAVHALFDAGFRVVIAPSFGDIFRSNCQKNGIVPVVLPAAAVAEILAGLAARPGARMAVDLERQLVTGPGNASWAFEIDPFVKECLLAGQDDIDLSLRHADAIAAFEAAQPGTPI